MYVMNYNKLGNTDIYVSSICLGGMMWGSQTNEKDAHNQLTYAYEHGINFIDTAEMYPIPPMNSTQGKSEEYIGNWVKKNKNRQSIVLATKVSGPAHFVNIKHIRNGPRLTKEHIRKAIDSSLLRLKTDYIDLYQVHWPERIVNTYGHHIYSQVTHTNTVKIEDTMDYLAEFVKEGKVRCIGICNETPWGTSQYLNTSSQMQVPRIQSLQNPYNLLNRSAEVGLIEMLENENISFIAYSPLAFGVLTGKYLTNDERYKSRLDLYPEYSRYNNSACKESVLKYSNLSEEYSITLTQLALSFISSKAWVTSTIIGASTIEQLKCNISHYNISLPEDLINKINVIHRSCPNPAP